LAGTYYSINPKEQIKSEVLEGLIAHATKASVAHISGCKDDSGAHNEQGVDSYFCKYPPLSKSITVHDDKTAHLGEKKDRCH
jgi:hypothetical protein